MIIPVQYRWDGEYMVPLPRFIKECNKDFVVGEVYRMEVVHERSSASHRQYFAAINEAFHNLPHHLASHFASSETLRKWCLIKTGWANTQSIVCKDLIDAARFADLLGRMTDDSVVVRKGNVIKIFTAKSQSVRAMNKDEFQRSKQDVLDLLATMIGTSAEELTDNAGKAA
jgi:hypothetical protein